jgi:hypothetical protein
MDVVSTRILGRGMMKQGIGSGIRYPNLVSAATGTSAWLSPWLVIRWLI